MEWVLEQSPFVVRRRVKWGECDPANAVYTVWFSEYVISAVMLFYEHLAGEGFEAMKARFGIDLPTRALRFDFTGTLQPDQLFDMKVTVGELRTRSYDLCVHARRPDGDPVFSAVFSPICVARDRREGVPIPDGFRELLVKATNSS
jgi:acyl-CoA thioesterase FadM